MSNIPPNIKNFITWYKDDKLTISFSSKPKISTLTYPPISEFASKDEILEHKKIIEDIDNKPYILRNSIWVKVVYKCNAIYFYINKNYRWNGANIPAFAWYIIGTPDDPKFRLSSMIHDWTCEHHADIENDRYLSTLMFCGLCRVAGVAEWRLSLAFHSIDNFQKLFGRDLNGKGW